MTTVTIPPASSPFAVVDLLYDHLNHTCLVMIDRSMWFAKSYEALAESNFEPLVRKHPQLGGRQAGFREPVVVAFSYAQRVFLCSAMELCLMHQHTNSVAVLTQLNAAKVHELAHLLQWLKRRKITSWQAWDGLDWGVRFEHLRQLSFSSLKSAAALFDDIYGLGCFDRAWGADEHRRLEASYGQYQTLRNGILHRGGELSSGVKIAATESDIALVFDEARRFRDAIRQFSDWCRSWWMKYLARPTARSG